MISKLNIIELSDVHLGHRTTETGHIIDNLLLLLPDAPSMQEVDLLIIAGDLFDRLLHLPQADAMEIQKWIYYLLHICSKYDIVLRVLEGTPSHDNRQNKLIMVINEESGIGCDVRYFDTLAIEYIDRFDINVLYIPDEYHPDASQTLAEVRLLLKEHNLTQVDFAVMHGLFDIQVPASLITRIPHHDSKAYLKLVKYLIYIGHHHKHLQYDRIMVAGSTDRLHHGEEEDKGIIKATVYENGEFKAEFVVNRFAKVYKTVDVSTQPMRKALEQIETVVANVPDGSYIRIRANQEDSISNSIRELKTTYPQITWSIQTDRAASSKTEMLSKPEIVMDNLHKDTIPVLLEKRMVSDYDTQTVQDVVNKIKEIIDESSNHTSGVAR